MATPDSIRREQSPRPIAARSLSAPADLVAQRLLGALLVRTLDDGTRLAGRIVETEAYMGEEDLAAHCRGGRRTPKTETMYAKAGTAYVYFTYGMHHCMNVVCASKDVPHAVLLRALEPIEGLDRMRAHRTAGRQLKKPLRDRDLCSGPGKLCQALAIDRDLNGAWLLDGDGPLTLERGPGMRRIASGEARVVNNARIGIGDCGEWTDRPLRWYLADSEHVSRR